MIHNGVDCSRLHHVMSCDVSGDGVGQGELVYTALERQLFMSMKAALHADKRSKVNSWPTWFIESLEWWRSRDG